ncbi:MAG: hypothetical protein OXF88_24995 [Rhodobacteraceae bacterium]|nr:hypothetical protein [Paracoccaceae bacterium]MCY4141381.1 hypothetical protein [Paracoccaceae bacterium]
MITFPHPGIFKAVVVLVAGAIAASSWTASRAGGLAGVATEWTQLANNAELANLTSLEASHLSVSSETLASEVEQLQTQILAYRNMVQNTERLPGSFHRQSLEPVLDLRRLYIQAGALAGSGQQLDMFLRSGLIQDPLFEQDAYSRNNYADRYTDWQDRWSSTLTANLQQSGMTIDDVETEARLLDALGVRADQVNGNLQALEVANEIAGSLARQVLDLRALTASQAETTAIAWSRVLAEQDVKRAIDRRFHETLEVNQQRISPGTGMHELLGIGQ